MIRLSKEKVLHLHQLMAEASGGSIGVREDGLLESALESAFGGFGDVEFYPTMEEKAARLGYSLISNHAFIDGNKRIGIFVLLVFLEVNDIPVHCTNEDVVHAALSVAAGKMDYAGLLAWVKEHTK